MFNFLLFPRNESHYQEYVDGCPSIQVSTFRDTNQKIVMACANLEDYAREDLSAPPLTKAQLAEIESGKIERERHRLLFDSGFRLQIGNPSTFRIKDVRRG